MPVTFPPRLKFTHDDHSPRKELGEKTEAFFQSLKNQEHDAIRQLAKQVGNFLTSLRGNLGLSTEDLEEIVNDSVLITLQKIRDGQFVLRDATPTTYAIAVAKNLAGNRMQKKRMTTTPLENFLDIPSGEFTPESYLLQKEKEVLLDALLVSLEESCRRLILLRYFEKVSDEEAILQNLTTFSNAKSLKVQRCKCLKKLAVMLHKHKRFFTEH